VDQVAIMAYDSGMPTGALYAGYLHRETELALRAVPPDRPLGVALYVDFTATAQDWAQYQARLGKARTSVTSSRRRDRLAHKF
jgi:hypothetical protein